MEFASSSSRFSKEVDEDEEQEEEEDEEVSPREIPFMTAAATADTGAASSSSSPSPSAAASASASGSAAALRSSDGAAGALGSGDDAVEVIEKEHMFDKVVTPSDVGKLNRLVIPKQHAEKHFPLDAAANERGRGLLLSFEDRAGKLWRFRYSYWNSSQSYVMTKGWSRFVKEKRLDAGDTVSFCRGAADAARDRLFIDWRKRRADTSRHPHPRLPLPVPPLASPYGYGPWGGGAGGFFVPPAPPATLYEHHRFRQALDFRNVNAAAPARQLLFFGSAGMPPRASMPPPPPPLHSVMMVQPSPAVPAGLPMLLDSVPLVNSPTAAAKRVRLFGVNLDNPQPGSSAESSQDTNALSLRMPGWQRPGPLRFFESPQRGAAGAAAGAESSAASSPSSSSSSKREAHSSVDLDL